MDTLGAVISWVITGLVVGALGRLAIPGPNPMTIGMTILVGIGGSLLGLLVAALLSAPVSVYLLLEIAGAALIVWLMQRRPRRAL